MKRDFPALWAEAPASLRREPTNAEMAGGFPCGDLDLYLFNELFYRLGQAYREISYCITQSGQTPNPNNTTQLWAAVQASSPSVERVHSGVDTGTAGHIVANVSPDIAGYDFGSLYLIKAATAAAGATDVNFDNRGLVTLLRADGTPTQKGDWLADEVLQIVSDGTNLRLFGVRSSLMPTRRLSSYTAAGTSNFIVPPGVTWIFAECVGAGGGGAGGGGGATWASGGGGSGGYAAGWVSVEPGQSIAVVVGAKGLGTNNANGAVGGTGGTSSVGSFIQATGGGGGRGSNTDCSGGTPGIGSGLSAQRALYGSNGGDGNPYSNAVQGGYGAASAFGGGGRTATNNAIIMNGNAPGSGGGGIWYVGTAQIGGNGADGAVFIQY